jgi:UDPglucose 6-dehydrogenase
VIKVNDLQLDRCVDKVTAAVDSLSGSTVGLWGLAFKAGTDDVRQSPAVKIGRELAARGATVTAYDPAVKALVDEEIRVVNDPIEAAKGADVLVVATEWPQFAGVDLRAVRSVMTGDAIVDVRNLLEPRTVRQLGMRYTGVGR